MPSIKEVKNRIGSVKSTQQLTKAMKMVAAAKLKKAQDKVLQLRPYSKKLNEILANLSDSVNNDLFSKRDDIKNVLIVIISSDKGLCGSFNSSLIKEFNSVCSENSNPRNTTVLPIGKKAFDFFKKSNFEKIVDYWDTLNVFNYEKSSEICDFIISSFIEHKFDKVSIIYNEFKNVAVQKTVSENFLPVIQGNQIENTVNNNYIFEPDKNKIISDLIPQTLKTQFLKAVLESNASEQGSRMTAMSQATDNAGELLKELKLTYNRTRQAAITKEILEIVGGAEALNN